MKRFLTLYFFDNNGRRVSLMDVIENREFLSILLKTGFVEIGE